MTIENSWAALLPRLEADLRSRSTTRAFAEDNDAWDSAASLLRAYGRVLIRIYPELQATEIDDLVQDALLKLQSLHIIDRIKAAVSPAGYIAIMLRNAATDLLRQRRRSFELSIAEEFEAPSGVDEDVATHYNAAKLRRALVRLTAEERNLLRMRFWRNLSIAQIAEILGTSYSAAAVRLFRILHRLREELR